MEEKATDDLREELMSDASLGAYLKQNEPFFSDESVGELLSALYEKKSITKAALARRADMSEVYLHQVFSGRRRPSRDRLLCLCIGLEAELPDIQTLLKRASHAQLYPRIKRDAIIIHGIVHRTALTEINEALLAEDEKALL